MATRQRAKNRDVANVSDENEKCNGFSNKKTPENKGFLM